MKFMKVWIKYLIGVVIGLACALILPVDNPSVSGDLVIETAPGWQILNEDSHENYFSRAAFIPFPIIMYGAGVKPGRVTTQATVDRIAPTVAKAIRIRAPNACSSEPLQ